MPKTKVLTPKQRKFVAEYVKTGNATRSAMAAYNTSTYDSAHQIASDNLQKAPIQQAIDTALSKHDLSIDNALGELQKVVRQDEELGAKRLAIRDVLELHGWRTGQVSAVNFKVDNAFFSTKAPVKPIQEGKLADPS